MSSPLSSKSPWLTLGGIVLLQSVSVASSLYPAYSSILGKKFSISQVQVVDLIAAVETGKLFECFPTAAADHLPPWAILLIGLLLGTVGHGVQYLYVAEKIQPSYWQMLLLCFLAGHSVCWIQTYCYFSALTNYLLLTCIAPACVGLVVVLIVGRSILAEHTETDVFPIAFALAVAAGVYAMLGNTVQPIKNMSSQLQVITLTLVIILPIAVPLVKAAHWLAMVRWRAKITPELPCVVTTENSDSIVRVDGLNEEAGEDDKEEEEKVDEGMENVGNVELGDEHGVKNLLMSLNFWLFYLVNACGPMLGVVYVNNLPRISGSYEAPSLIAVFAASGFCGRIFSVSIEEYTRRGLSMLSTPASIVIMMIPMSASFFLLINSSKTVLYISTGVIGACTGAIREITTFKIAELFGPQNSVVNQNIVLTNIPIGTLLYGHLDAINYKTGADGNDGICKGFECHHKTFIIWGSIAAVGIVLSLILHLRTRKFYSLG